MPPYDHSFKDAPQGLSSAQAARYLVTGQSFLIGFGISHVLGGSKSRQVVQFRDAPLARGFLVLALGKNLFETLALNLLPYNTEEPIPHLGQDKPVWEQDDPAQPDRDGTLAHGWLDYLTWQSRRIHLVPEDDGSVCYCQLQQNLKLADSPPLLDPFKCYQRKDAQEPFQPLGLRPDRALWRDSHILFQQIGKQGVESQAPTKRPEIFNHLAQIERERQRGEIAAQTGYAFAAYGFATEIRKAASVIFWTRERLPLPLSYLIEPELVGDLRFALCLADDREQSVSTALRESIRALAKLLAAPLSDDGNARQPDPNDIRNIANSFSAHEFYWAQLDRPFKKLLTDLPKDFQHKSGDTAQPGDEAMTEWVATLQRTARTALDKAINSLSGSAHDLKAAAQAEKVFGREMKKLRDKYPHYFTHTRTAGGK